MKRLIAILLAAMLMLAVLPVSALGAASAEAAPNATRTVYRTTASVLNVRSGPKTSFKVINQLRRGTPCVVLEKSGNWRRVKALNRSVTGWVSNNYLSAYAYGRVATRGGNLNVRTGPSTGYRVKGSVRNGTSLTVKKNSGNWAYVTGGGLTGWVSLNYVAF